MQYRKLDLVIVGGKRKGKSSLVKGLNRSLKKKAFPVDEIGIYNWEYSPPAGDGPAVVFRIWDFPNEVVTYCNKYIFEQSLQEYDTTVNYHFYSKQAIYLAVINLINSDNEMKEVNVFLKNIKVVIAIATHFRCM